MNTAKQNRKAGRLAALACALTVSAQAAIIVNGGFESGFAGWTTTDQIGSEGTFALQTGVASPVNGLPVPAPPAGSTAAMTDAAGPGSHVLYQDFVVPSVVPAASLSLSLFINNSAVAFHAPAHLDFGTPDLNQQARVDILLGSADPFTTAPGDILLNLFQTLPGDPLVAGYGIVQTDLTALLQAHAGQTLRLRFAEVDNVDVFNLGVDAVDLRVIPEPDFWSLCTGIGCLLAAAARRRNRSGNQHANAQQDPKPHPRNDDNVP